MSLSQSATGRREGTAAQEDTPYLDALRAYAAREPGRFHVPGHKGGAAADPRLVDALGEEALALDIPALTYGIDMGIEPAPFFEAQRLAAAAWGAERTWFLVNGASQLDATPGAVGATVVSPTYFGALADVAALAEVAHARGVPLIVDEAWGAHLAFHPDLPASALSLGADLVISSIHKIVGSLTQSALIHLGRDSLLELDLIDRCVTLLESTSPNSYLYASLDSARRAAAVNGEELLSETLSALRVTRRAVRAIPDLDVLDERLAGAPGVFDYDPLRLAIDVRGTSCSGYDLARKLREEHDVQMELAGENVMVAVFGMSEDATAAGERLVSALRRVVEDMSAAPAEEAEVLFAPPPPWGELVMSPREAFLGPQEVVPARDAIGRVAAESLAAYPPGIPNVLPGERLSAETLDYVQQALDHGGALRGASDRRLHTLRVALED
jgi:arginine decarboxylase